MEFIWELFPTVLCKSKAVVSLGDVYQQNIVRLQTNHYQSNNSYCFTFILGPHCP